MKHKAGRLALLAVWVLGAGTAGAQTTTWTIDDAVKAAVDHNLSLERTAWDLEAKKRQNDKAWNVFLPSATVTAGLTRANEATNPYTGASIDPPWAFSQSLGLSLTVTGNLFASLDAVALNYRSGVLTYDLAKKSLEKNVRLIWYSLLLEQENLKLTQDSIDRAAKNLAKVQANYKAGLVPELDVLSAQVALEQLKPQLQQLQATYLNDVGQLKFLTAQPLDRDLELAGGFPDLDGQSIDPVGGLARGSSSPDVLKAQLNVDSAALNQWALNLNSWIPALTVSWSRTPYLADATASSPKWTEQGTFGVRLTYTLDSLVPWTGAKENLLQADDGLRKAQSQLAETKANSELVRRNAIRSIQQAVQSLTSLQLNVELAKKTYELSLDAFNRGSKDLLALQTSEGDLNAAKYKVLSQRYNLLSNILNLEYELNVPFGTLLGGKP